FVDERQPFDVDRLTLNVTADVATLHGSVGITDRLEVGGALPLVTLYLTGSRVDTYRASSFTEAVASSTAIGLADAVARVKYTLYRKGGSAVAGAVEARLPTGRSADLLGAGALSAKFSGIGSIEHGRLATHINVGAAVGGLEREFEYDGAAVFAIAR